MSVAKDWDELFPLRDAEPEPGLEGMLSALARHVAALRALPGELATPFSEDMAAEDDNADLA
jgi:hypothetical protein